MKPCQEEKKGILSCSILCVSKLGFLIIIDSCSSMHWVMMHREHKRRVRVESSPNFSSASYLNDAKHESIIVLTLPMKINVWRWRLVHKKCLWWSILLVSWMCIIRLWCTLMYTEQSMALLALFYNSIRLWAWCFYWLIAGGLGEAPSTCTLRAFYQSAVQ